MPDIDAMLTEDTAVLSLAVIVFLSWAGYEISEARKAVRSLEEKIDKLPEVLSRMEQERIENGAAAMDILHRMTTGGKPKDD
jgi:hypothetical protein